MRSPTFLLAFALSLLPCLTSASNCDNVAIDRLPVSSSSDGPFVIRAQGGFNVVLKYDKQRKAYVPVISRTEVQLPEFLLTDGNLTSSDKSLAAYYSPVPLIYPPVLGPLLFSKNAPPALAAEVIFVTKTRDDGSGREIRRIFLLNGRELES